MDIDGQNLENENNAKNIIKIPFSLLIIQLYKVYDNSYQWISRY